jgi:hypothetical protein
LSVAGSVGSRILCGVAGSTSPTCFLGSSALRAAAEASQRRLRRQAPTADP